MIGVIRDKEVHDAFVFSVFLLHIAHLQRTVAMTIVGLDNLLTVVFQHSVFLGITIYDTEVHGVSFLPVRWIERPGSQEDVEHVEDTLAVGVLLPLAFAFVINLMLAHMATTFWIRVEHFVSVISVALMCSLMIVERGQIEGRVAEQRVAEHEKAVSLGITSCDK